MNRLLICCMLFSFLAHAEPLVQPMDAIDLDPADGVVSVRLTAAAYDGGAFQYAYNGQVPGPVIRTRVGDILSVEMTNDLNDPTTIHWHGLHVPFAMDGVPWMMDPIAPGETFIYTFATETAGTFWYHPHFDTESQVDAGLYGLLIVEDSADPVPDDEVLLVFDTIAEHNIEQNALPLGDPTLYAHGHAQLHQQWTINGAPAPLEYTARGGQTVRVRILNASNASYLDLANPDLRLIARDQGLLPGLQMPDHVVLGPGDRAELEWRIGQSDFELSSAPYSLNGGETLGDSVPLVQVNVEVPANPPDGLPWPFQAGVVSEDPPYTDIIYAFSGSDRTGRWLINGEAFPNITIQELHLGDTAIIEIRNVSPTEHPFHQHGMPFEVLSRNGVPPAYRTIEDTLNIGIRERVRLKVHATNVGDWMTHCHILPHADDGMMTVLRVLPE